MRSVLVIALVAVAICPAAGVAQAPGGDPAAAPPRADTSGPAVRFTRAHFDGRRLGLTFLCSERCGGRVDAFFVHRLAGSARTGRPRARRHRVHIRLGPRGRRLLLRRGSIAVRAVLRDDDGDETRLLVDVLFIRG